MMEYVVVAFLQSSVYPQTLHVHLVPRLGAMQIQAPRTVGAKYEWEARLESNDGNWVTILAWWGKYQEDKEHCLSL